MFRLHAYIIYFVMVSTQFTLAQTEPESKTTSERYRDWTFNCIAVDGIEQCEIATRIIAQDGSVFSQNKCSDKRRNDRAAPSNSGSGYE